MKRSETLIPFMFKEADISNVPKGNLIELLHMRHRIIWISGHYSSELIVYLFPVDSVTQSFYRNEKKTHVFTYHLHLLYFTLEFF